MKKLTFTIFILMAMNLIYSCSSKDEDDVNVDDVNKDDVNGLSDKQLDLIGSWKRNILGDWGKIKGTKKIIFSRNLTYYTEIKRIGASEPCRRATSYCNESYSGKYLVRGNTLSFNPFNPNWTRVWRTWSVEGHILRLGNKTYIRQ